MVDWAGHMSMIIAALTMKRDGVKRETLRKDLGGRGAPKADLQVK